MGKKRFSRLEMGGKRIDDRPSEKGLKIEAWQRKCSNCGRIVSKSGNCFYCGLEAKDFVVREMDTKTDDAPANEPLFDDRAGGLGEGAGEDIGIRIGWLFISARFFSAILVVIFIIFIFLLRGC